MLKLEGVSKRLGKFSLESISFQVEKGDYFILLGPSGAGKSVLLEIVAGLIIPDSGKIHINGEDVTHSSIQARSVGLVFQDLALFPHLSVRQNIAYPLRRKGLKSSIINRKVVELASKFSISHLLRRSITTLSGGEQQRVALARILALEPSVLLLDEPLSSLDVELKADVRKILRDLNRNGQTIIHVTHDYEEAIALGNRIAVMNNGLIEQTGTPQEVFANPTSPFVASFGGIRNFFPAVISTAGEGGYCKARVNKNVEIHLYSSSEGEGFVWVPDSSVTISETPANTSAQNSFKGVVADIYPRRFGWEIIVDIGIKVYAALSRESVEKLNLNQGRQIWVTFKASSVGFIAKE